MIGLQYHNVYLPTRPTLDLYNCCCGCDLVVILPGFDLTNAVDATDFDGEVVPFVTNFLVGPLVSCFNGALLVGFAGAFPGIPVLVVTVSVDPSGRVIVVRVVVMGGGGTHNNCDPIWKVTTNAWAMANADHIYSIDIILYSSYATAAVTVTVTTAAAVIAAAWVALSQISCRIATQ